MKLLVKVGAAFCLIFGFSTTAQSYVFTTPDPTLWDATYSGVFHADTVAESGIRTKFAGDKYRVTLATNHAGGTVVTALTVENLSRTQNFVGVNGGSSFRCEHSSADYPSYHNICFSDTFTSTVGDVVKNYELKVRFGPVQHTGRWGGEWYMDARPAVIDLYEDGVNIAPFHSIPQNEGTTPNQPTTCVPDIVEGVEQACTPALPTVSIFAVKGRYDFGRMAYFRLESDYVFQEDTVVKVDVAGKPHFAQFWANYKTTYLRVHTCDYVIGRVIRAELDETPPDPAKYVPDDTIFDAEFLIETPRNYPKCGIGESGQDMEQSSTDSSVVALADSPPEVSITARKTDTNTGEFIVTATNGNFTAIVMRRIIKRQNPGGAYGHYNYDQYVQSVAYKCPLGVANDYCLSRQDDGSYKMVKPFQRSKVVYVDSVDVVNVDREVADERGIHPLVYKHNNGRPYPVNIEVATLSETIVLLPAEVLKIRSKEYNFGDNYTVSLTANTATLHIAGTTESSVAADLGLIQREFTHLSLAPNLVSMSLAFNDQFEQTMDFAMANLGEASFSFNGSDSISDFIALGGRMANGNELRNNYSFSLPVMADQSLPMTIWGYGLESGDHLGLGFHPRDDFMVGVSVATNEYTGDLADSNYDGVFRSNMTALMSHIAWTEDASSLRVSAGTGSGSIRLDLTDFEDEAADSVMHMATANGRQVLFTDETDFGNVELAIGGKAWAIRQAVEDNGSLIRKSDETTSQIEFSANGSYDVSFWDVALDLSAEIGTSDQKIKSGLSYTLLDLVTPYMDVGVDTGGLNGLGFGSRIVSGNDVNFHLGTKVDEDSEWNHRINGTFRW